MGTFPLPEAQLDRFLMIGKMNYPTYDEGIELLERFDKSNPYETLKAVVTVEELLEAIREI